MGLEWILATLSCCSVLAAGVFTAATLGKKHNCSWKLLSSCAFVSLAVQGICGLAAFLNSGNAQMLIDALENPGTANFWQLITSLCFIFFSSLYYIGSSRNWRESSVRATAYSGIFCAVALMFAIGKSFDQYWQTAGNSWTLVVPFLGWAISTGVFCWNALSKIAADEAKTHKGELSALIFGYAMILAYPVSFLFAEAEEAKLILRQCLTGNVACIFWLCMIGLGILFPFIMTHVVKVKQIQTALICLVLTLIGTASFQWLVLMMGTATWQFFQT